MNINNSIIFYIIIFIICVVVISIFIKKYIKSQQTIPAQPEKYKRLENFLTLTFTTSSKSNLDFLKDINNYTHLSPFFNRILTIIELISCAKTIWIDITPGFEGELPKSNIEWDRPILYRPDYMEIDYNNINSYIIVKIAQLIQINTVLKNQENAVILYIIWLLLESKSSFDIIYQEITYYPLTKEITIPKKILDAMYNKLIKIKPNEFKTNKVSLDRFVQIIFEFLEKEIVYQKIPPLNSVCETNVIIYK